MDATIESDLPPAAGLSSSSALIVAFTLACSTPTAARPTFDELMEILPDGEQFVGTRGGGMDHAASLASRAGLRLADRVRAALGAPHSDSRGLGLPGGPQPATPPKNRAPSREQYNAVRTAGNDGASRDGLRVVRRSDRAGAPRTNWRTLAAADTAARFLHVSHRSPPRARAPSRRWKSADAGTFGRLLLDSHASLRDRLRSAARRSTAWSRPPWTRARLGARLTGAGFGGCAVVFCRRATLRQSARRNLIERFYSGCPDRRFFNAEPGLQALYTRSSYAALPLDWIIAFLSVAICFVPALFFGKRSGKSTAEFFASGRSVPWWLAGLSMVATTFSSDTPNLVANFVRTQGVAGNWQWWAFTLTGVSTVFFYARLWRRSGVLTDLEFYELRYSGKAASAVRGFRAVYLGLFFNCIIMATVNLAACKIAAILFGLERWQTLLAVGLLNVVFATHSGLWGVLVIDMIQFFIKMSAVIAAAYFAVKLPQVGGLSGLVDKLSV